MIKLEIALLSRMQTVLFDDRASAEAALLSLRTELNKDKYARNEKTENVHTVQSPAGPIDVVLDKVESVRIIDAAVWDEQVAPLVKAETQRAQDFDLDHRRKILELERSFSSIAPNA